MKCLIVDDEPLAREGLKEYVTKVPFLELTGEAATPLDAMKIMEEQSVDLLFLDIQMPELSGLEFLKALQSDAPLVILTTAYPHFALEGYALEVLDYLVKPITFERFFQAVNRAKRQFELENQVQQQPGASLDSIFVRTGSSIQKIRLADLYFAESMQNYVRLFTRENRIVVHMPMKQLEDELPGRDFLRVHKSYLVNLRAVDGMEGNSLLIGEERVPISRSRVEEVRQRLLGDQLLG